MSASKERFPFVPPTEPEGLITNYDFLRPDPEEITHGQAPFTGMNPFEFMEHMGPELAAESGVTKWSITYDIQEACGVVLMDKDMKNMLGWAEEAIQRHKIVDQKLPTYETKRALWQKLYDIDIEDFDNLPAKKKA